MKFLSAIIPVICLAILSGLPLYAIQPTLWQEVDFIPDPVAYIEGEPYSRSSFLADYVNRWSQNDELDVEKLQKELYAAVVSCVDRQLLLQEAFKAGAVLSEELTLLRLQRDFERLDPARRFDFELQCNEMNLTVEEAIQRRAANPEFQKQLLVDSFVGLYLRSNLSVDPKEIHDYYQAHPEEFVVPADPEGTIRGEVLIVGGMGADAKSMHLARDTVEFLLANPDWNFTKIANDPPQLPAKIQIRMQTYSATPEAQKEHPELAELMKSVEIHSIGGPFPVNHGQQYWFIHRLPLQQAKTIGELDAIELIRPVLLQQKLSEALEKYLDDLFRLYKVVICVPPPEAAVPPVPSPEEEEKTLKEE